MNLASFTIRKSVLLKNLRELYKLSPWNKSSVLELTITDGKLTLVIPGAKHVLDCETKSTAKATISLSYFLNIIKTQKDIKIQCKITEGTLEIKGLFVNIQTTFFETDSILRSIKMPLNYTDWHLLKLEKEGYTHEEIEFNKLNFEVYYAKKTLNSNILKAFHLLKIYGFTKKEIKETIYKKGDL